MNTLTLTRHLLLKDFRHQRSWVALVWVSAALLPLLAFFVNGKADGFVELGAIGFFLLIFLVLARLIRIDAPGREFHFLATRPVPWRVMLGGKIVFAALFLLVPFWIAKLGSVFIVGIPVNLPDILLILVESAIFMGAVFAAVALFSFFFRNLAVVFLAMFATFILVLSTISYLRMFAYTRNMVPGAAYTGTLDNCKFLVFYLGVIATVGAVAIARYRLKSILKPLGILAVGLILTVLVTKYWPYDLSRLFADAPQNTGEVASPLRDQIKFSLNTSGDNAMNYTGSSINGIKSISLENSAKLEGLESPYYAVLVDYHSDATLKSGRVIHSSYQDVNWHGNGYMQTYERLRQQIAGFKQAKEFWERNGYQLFTYRPDDYSKEDLTGAEIKGVLTFEIRKVVLLKTMPFKPGVRINLPRCSFLIQNVVFSPGGPSYRFVTNSVNSTLRGDGVTGAWENLTSLVFNRVKDEYLVANGRSGNTSSGPLYNTQTDEDSLRRGTVNGDPKKQNEPLSGDWMDGAEISFFTTESAGRISFPYEVKNANLEH